MKGNQKVLQRPCQAPRKPSFAIIPISWVIVPALLWLNGYHRVSLFFHKNISIKFKEILIIRVYEKLLVKTNFCLKKTNYV